MKINISFKAEEKRVSTTKNKRLECAPDMIYLTLLAATSDCQFPSVLSKRSQSTDIFFKKQKKWLDVKADWLAAPLKWAEHTVFSRISEEISRSTGVKKSHKNGKDTLKKHLNYLVCSRNSRPPTLFILHLFSKCVLPRPEFKSWCCSYQLE